MKKEDLVRASDEHDESELIDLGTVSELTEGRPGGNTELLVSQSISG